MGKEHEIYKILQLNAKDIYENTRYDGNGNKASTPYKIYLTKKVDKIYAIKDYKIPLEEIKDNLKDSVYEKDGEVIAVEVNKENENINEKVNELKCFKVVNKNEKNYYSFIEKNNKNQFEKKFDPDTLSYHFKGSMSNTLDLEELKNFCKDNDKNKKGKEKEELIKSLGNHKYTTAFISVNFKGKSNEFIQKKDFYTVYIKKEYSSIYVKKDCIDKFDITKLNEAVYVEDDKVIAVKVDFKIDEENKNVTNLSSFKIKGKKEKQYSYIGEDDEYINYDDVIKSRLNDAVYVEDGKVIAVMVDAEIKEENENVVKLWFEIKEKNGKKYYSLKAEPNAKQKEYINKSFYNSIYVKRGYYNITLENIKNNLNDSVYVKDNDVVAVMVDTNIKKSSDKVTELKHFEVIEENGHKYYSYKKNTYKKIDVDSKELRKELYEKGFSIILLDSTGEVIETNEYVRYKRSASNAKSGKCLFINKNYFKHMNSWSYLNDKTFEEDDMVNKKTVEREAYKALSLSSLKGTIELEPKNILILKDEFSKFKDKCIVVRLEKTNDGKNEELVVNKEDVEIENNIWDGEGLLDESIFKTYGYENKGMMLLRNRYFKCCAFNTKLQIWFKRNKIEHINQLNGFTLAEDIKDIMLVVTESSLKALKFSDAKKEKYKGNTKAINLINEEIFIRWMNSVGKIFGVVKTDQPTHRFNGRVVQTSYQLLNTLGMKKNDDNDEIARLIEPSYNYIKEIKNRSAVFDYYLKNEDYYTENDYLFDTLMDSLLSDEDEDYESDDEYEFDDIYKEISDESDDYKFKICSKLLEINPNFAKTKLYLEFRDDRLDDIKNRFKKGKLLIPGTYATIFGNGYELLLATINKFDIKKTKPLIGKGQIMCKRIKYGKEVCAARSPHITMGNLYIAKNIKVKEYNKYFNLSKEIVCVNAIGENIQQKLNGMDYDSDTMLVTDFEPIVEAAKLNYEKFLVPVCKVDSKAKDDSQELYEIDHVIANNYTGDIVNLSQHLNSIIWDKYNETGEIDNKIYLDVCKLAVLSGMEIDKAKRDYPVKSKKEYDNIRDKIDTKYTKYKKLPMFRKDSNSNYEENREYMKYNTTMDYIYNENFGISDGNKIRGIKIIDIINKKNTRSNNPAAYKEKVSIIKAKLDEFNVSYKNTQTSYNLNIKNEKDKKVKKILFEERNKKIKEMLDNFYSNIFKLVKHPLTVRLLIERMNYENDIWPILHVLYKCPVSEKNKGKYNNLLEEVFYSDVKPEKLVECIDKPIEDIKNYINLFGIYYKIVK